MWPMRNPRGVVSWGTLGQDPPTFSVTVCTVDGGDSSQCEERAGAEASALRTG